MSFSWSDLFLGGEVYSWVYHEGMEHERCMMSLLIIFTLWMA